MCMFVCPKRSHNYPGKGTETQAEKKNNPNATFLQSKIYLIYWAMSEQTHLNISIKFCPWSKQVKAFLTEEC